MPLQANNISKQFGGETVLSELSLQLKDQETLSILGRSGCGKTTLLKICAGLQDSDSGLVTIEGTKICSLSPQNRPVVYLYQEALLFPHLNVFENIAFGLRLRNKAEEDISTQTNDMITKLGLDGMAQKMPHQLSGGQKQRVSFGRALITNPKVLLLDEPFGNLDADTRSQMQRFFKKIAQEFEITAIFVTHNIKEAILMGDRIANMNNGKLTIYPSLEEFLAADHKAVQEEIKFWKLISNTN
ncbi:putrescine transport system ATP-binding protein [Fodinibius salinus]|uniref:Putrescine transport system ATP-binding protein n=1 Tax=Fodinibius salinus TaxID=860790 RepID=A0A5D3YIN0_9BACT|nr:ABC transporter ATP-binding protein [Fodinibius salinus]TYP93643.1 putrescine transport system ATP-binding protein [Fodinibius salinus]